MLRAPPSPDRERRAQPAAASARVLTDPPAPTRRLAKPWLLGGAGGVVVLAIALLASGPLVRARVAKEAARRRLDVTVGSVRPGFFAVSLKDVHVRLQNAAGAEVRFDDVRVDLSAGLLVREVTAHGGEIRIEGEPEDLVERLKAFQKDSKIGTPPADKGRKPAVSADGLSLVWKLADGEIVGSAIGVSRDDEAIRFACAHLTAAHRRSSIEIVGADVELAPDGTARRIAAAAVTIAQEPLVKALPAAPSAPAAAVVADPAPPLLPLPVAAAGTKGGSGALAVKSGAKPAAPVAAPGEPVLPLPDLHAVRARIATFTQAFGTRVPDGSKVDIAGLSVKLDVGGEAFAFGPGPFTMERHADVIRLTFASDKGGDSSTTLALDAELPLAAGDVTAKLSGGPVSLALLGVKEGTKGLLDVAKGTVSGRGMLVLSAPGDALTFDGQIALKAITVKQSRLAAEPLRGIDLGIAARGLLTDAGVLRVDDAQFDMGALHVRTHGTLEETSDHFGLALSVDVAPAACQSLLESTPQGLLPTVRTARMTGTFGGSSHVVFDTRTIDKLVLDYDIDDRCRIAEVPPELSRDRFSTSFTYRTYHPDGTPSDTTTGPNTSSWTDLDGISPFMVAAVLTTEDGAFYKHHGFNHNAIKNSVAANLKARRFVRGASTITMQLAKNLFLSREKTLSRKIEEVILTDYLEQAFRKDDMMELYLNVVEFGPDVYGITRAAEHYFGRKPEELNLPECFFLASLMPAPVRYGRQRDRGQVSEGWMHHLQNLMAIAAKNRKVSRAELTEGLAQPVVFYRAGDPRPEPRKPVSSGRRDPLDDDSGWQPLD